jgi:hypothetical protein
VSLDIHLRVLQNMKGIYLTEEIIGTEPKFESLDEVPVDRKSSVFWFEYEDYKGELKESDKKAWIDHF